MSEQEEKPIPEILIPKGYKIEDILDMDDGDFEEKPIAVGEVKIRFE